MAAFDNIVYPCLTAVFGPPPDIDGNRAVILLVTRTSGAAGRFWRFNQLPQAVAQSFGFHSNQAELLYTDLGFAGNRRRDNLAALASAFGELLLFARDAHETAWSRSLAAYGTTLCGYAAPHPPVGPDPPATRGRGAELSFRGVWLGGLEYLRQRAGIAALTQLAANPRLGLAGLDEVVRQLALADGAAGLLADAAMAAWLDDPLLGQGRFSFPGACLPSRPAVEIDASRAATGTVTVPVGFPTYLRLRRSGERAQPLSLQGQPEVRWAARAVRLRPRGPDQELALAFDSTAACHLDLSPLQPGDEILLAALPLPPPSPTLDRREVQLLWGLGWVPRPPGLSATEDFKRLLAARFPDGGTNATAALAAVMARLCGTVPAPGGVVVTTRYAWAPPASAVVELLRQEAAERRLPVRVQSYLRVTPSRLTQEWSNLLIELPGTDPRRWPVVVAAHWDATRSHVDDAYAAALGAHDNASGVAVALEAAGAIARARHRAPVLVALLSGGCHGAAGAQALLEELAGRVTAWIELDGVGVSQPFPNHSTVTVSGDVAHPHLGGGMVRTLRDQGLRPRLLADQHPPHSGAAVARHRGIPAVTLATATTPPTAAEADVPVEVELATISPELMALLGRAVASLAVSLAGPAVP